VTKASLTPSPFRAAHRGEARHEAEGCGEVERVASREGGAVVGQPLHGMRRPTAVAAGDDFDGLGVVADALLSARTVLAEQLDKLQKRLVSLARQDTRARRLMSTPGVGEALRFGRTDTNARSKFRRRDDGSGQAANAGAALERLRVARLANLPRGPQQSFRPHGMISTTRIRQIRKALQPAHTKYLKMLKNPLLILEAINKNPA
jgi:hypothetical protein